MNKILIKIKKIIPKKLWNILWPIYHFSIGLLGNIIYKSPSQKMIVIGVTGTTGKTTCVYFIAKTLQSAGYKVGFTSTAMFGDGEKEWTNEKKMTMVGRFFTYKLLDKMVKNGCQFAVIETTSEGIVQYRHRFINYDTLVFTGLYPEHIESHGCFEKYKEAKGMLFAHLKQCKTKYINADKTIKKVESGLKKISLNRVKKTIIVNGDDEYKDYFLNFWAEQKIQYKTIKNSIDVEANELELKDYSFKEIVATNLSITNKGTLFNICERGVCKEPRFNFRVLGEFNIANALTAVAVGLSFGLTLEIIKDGLEKITGVPGRLEKIEEGQKFSIIVDYAFEPKAMEKLYETIKASAHRKIIHVLGATGGGRDVARRPVLGKIAGENADVVIVTNEDPYDDDPLIIMDQVAIGAEKAGKIEGETLLKINDRRLAISRALKLAEPGDMILITGKGNEQAICVANGEKIPWDDRVVVREELAKL